MASRPAKRRQPKVRPEEPKLVTPARARSTVLADLEALEKALEGPGDLERQFQAGRRRGEERALAFANFGVEDKVVVKDAGPPPGEEKRVTFADVKVDFKGADGLPFKFLKFKDLDFGFEPMFFRMPPRPDPPQVKRDRLLAEVTNLDDLCKSIDLSGFPLPMRVEAQGTSYWCCNKHAPFAKTAQVIMKVKPRGLNELPGVPRDANGLVELKSCSGVTEEAMGAMGNAAALEGIREFVKHMVMHEVYESFLFRGERIMDPHNEQLRPKDQLF